jgi:large subunit ribosomal protein L25
MDFQRVQEESIISTKVPINIINQKSCIGLKSGGKIIIKLIDAEIKCKAKYLPERINLDIKELKLDQSVYLSDLNLGNEIILLALKKGYNKIIASIKIPKKLKNEISKENNEDESSQVDKK